MLRIVSALLSLTLVLATPLASAQSAEDARPAPSTTVTVDSADADEPVPAVSEAEPSTERPWDEPGTYARNHADDYVGVGAGWSQPYERESLLDRTGPPIRYNRVEGLVLGLERDPLSLRDPHETARIHGELSYAFALRDLRYTVGLESKLIRDGETALKVGVSYQKQTISEDRWKTSFAENSLAGFGFRYDFFDYYEAEGLSVYAVQALPRSVELTAGFRTEEHRPLEANTRWSLFDTGTFRDNPVAESGRRRAGFASVQGGDIDDRDDLPTGSAFRIAASIGSPFQSRLSHNRYVADARVFLPLSHDTRLGLRLRGGYETSDAPVQSQFTLGGIGSVRSYDQNSIRGTRMLLANAEYIIDGATLDDDFLDDLFLVGLFDAGWVGGPNDQFHMGDVLPSAGFGVGLDEREVRIDVSWPLRSHPTAASGPSIWLRITPNF